MNQNDQLIYDVMLSTISCKEVLLSSPTREKNSAVVQVSTYPRVILRPPDFASFNHLNMCISCRWKMWFLSQDDSL